LSPLPCQCEKGGTNTLGAMGRLSALVIPPCNVVKIGVGKTGHPVSPPSEPYVRFSRIRLSSQWFTSMRIDKRVRELSSG